MASVGKYQKEGEVPAGKEIVHQQRHSDESSPDLNVCKLLTERARQSPIWSNKSAIEPQRSSVMINSYFFVSSRLIPFMFV